MCGRYSLSRPLSELAEFFQAAVSPGLFETYRPRYNIAPTHVVVGLAEHHHHHHHDRQPHDDHDRRRRTLEAYRWGFGHRQFNTRSEGVADAPRRMAMVADGFFEWRAELDRGRQALFFRRPDGAPLALAGLWNGGRDRMCTMLTTAAGPDLAGIHARMPVVLAAGALERWLDPAHLDRHELRAICQPAPGGTLVHHPVDPRVGDVRNDGPELVAPYDPPEPAPRLFG